MRRDIYIGDVHGCFEELMHLLDELAVTPEDRVISLGDFVDRGPDSVRLWEFFRDRPNTVVIMGNHERKHVRGILSYSQEIVRLQFGDRYEAFRAWAAELPYYFETDEVIAVHGGFEDGVRLADQREVVLSCTTSGARYLDEIYGGDWTERYTGDKALVFGHRIVGEAPVWFGDRVIGLDMGACHGAYLSALVVPGFEVHRVRASADHWAREKVRWKVPVLRSRAWSTYRWSKLGNELAILRQSRRADVVRFGAELERWVEGLVGRIPDLIAAAEARVAELRAEHADDKAFKRRVAGEPVPALLFGAEAGTLDEAAVRAHLPTLQALERALTVLQLQAD